MWPFKRKEKEAIKLFEGDLPFERLHADVESGAIGGYWVTGPRNNDMPSLEEVVVTLTREIARLKAVK